MQERTCGAAYLKFQLIAATVKTTKVLLFFKIPKSGSFYTQFYSPTSSIRAKLKGQKTGLFES